MLAPMNPPAFDYKPFGHQHHPPPGLLEPQHDDLPYTSHHASTAAYPPSWSNQPGLSFGAFDPTDDNDEVPVPDDTSGVKKKKLKNGKKETFVCPEVHCGKTFPRSFALRRHMRIHTGTKPYACDVDGCTQRFNTSGNLSRHKRIHSGERPYPCVFATCGKRFNTSTKLKRHMRIHFPDGQCLFHCVSQACTFACDNYKEYVHHQRQHGNPAYIAKDENMDESNLVQTASTPTTTKAGRNTKASKTKRPPQPRVTKASKAAATATTAALTGEYLMPGDRRFDHHHQSPTTTAASAGLSMLMKEAHREDQDNEYNDHRRPPLNDRPARLPFPTGAFPSESIAGASPMNLNLSTTFGSSFSTGRVPTTSSQGYYDHPTSTSSFPSYLRGPPSDVFQHHHPHHGHASSYHDAVHFPPLRPEDGGADDGYDSPSPRGRHMSHHHHDQPRDTDESEDDKYGGYAPPHAVGSDFTGEELSAVLELMKDS